MSLPGPPPRRCRKRDLLALRDKTSKELSASTANTDLKILRIAFRQAVNDGLRLDNPAAAVNILKQRKADDAPERRPFTEEELRKLLAVAKGEWHDIILAGLYTGQRLGDVASMRWKMIDFKERTINFLTRKTGRTVIIPIVAQPSHRIGQSFSALRRLLREAGLKASGSKGWPSHSRRCARSAITLKL